MPRRVSKKIIGGWFDLGCQLRSVANAALQFFYTALNYDIG